MRRLIPSPLLGVVTAIVAAAHLAGVFTILFLPFAIPKLLVPHAGFRRACSRRMLAVGSAWARSLRLIVRMLHGTAWPCMGAEAVQPDTNYLLLCNHSSWADIPILASSLSGRAPFPRFFIKREMLWVPIIGFAAWALDYPFMRRHSKARLERQPELASEDLRATQAACARFRELPATICNFAEGTRATEAKRHRQGSPYRHLLRPKAGGTAFTLNAMDGLITQAIDMTIVLNTGGKKHLWAVLCGAVNDVQVYVRVIDIPPRLLSGDYRNDPEYRLAVQNWLNGIWDEKEALIEAHHRGLSALENAMPDQQD